MVVNRESTKSLRERGLGCFALHLLTVIDILSRAAGIACVGAAMLAGSSGGALSQAQRGVSSAERCLAANLDLSSGAQLPHTAARLKSSERLKIVAIGSSSTVGLWVIRSAATYPEVMRQEFLRLRYNATINVVNSGRIGDPIPGNIARFERDVFGHAPDLVRDNDRLISSAMIMVMPNADGSCRPLHA
jgi:hypothetical protein